MVGAEHLPVNTVLLICMNIIGALVFFQVQDFKLFLRETRKKIDDHVEDKSVHCDVYKAQVVHGQK